MLIHKTLFEDYKKHFKKVIYNLNSDREDKFKDFVTIHNVIKKDFNSVREQILNAKSLKALHSENKKFIEVLKQ